MPAQLRRLFAHLVMHCELKDPRKMWDQFVVPLSADYRRRHPLDVDVAVAVALKDIRNILGQMGKTLAECSLPEPREIAAPLQTSRELDREMAYDRDAEAEKAIAMRLEMYDQQAATYDEIVACVLANTPGAFFVDGPGGAGKTYLYTALLHRLRGEGLIALACAWSGIAAVLLAGGRTCHSTFGLPVPMPVDIVLSSIKAQSGRAEVLRRASIIVWDEAPMAPKEALEAVDVLLRDLTRIDAPFGGKVLVLGGDFRQVLPVMPHSSRPNIISHSLQAHPLWKQGHVQVRRLGKNMRAREDQAWREYLISVGDGLETVHDALGPFVIRLPEEIVAPSSWTHVDLVRFVFPDLAAAALRCATPGCRLEDRKYFCERAVLAPTNAQVDALNAEILKELDASTLSTYLSEDKTDAASTEEESHWPLDFLNSLTPTGMPPHELVLGPGALVMLLRNLDPDAGLCNGVRAIVVRCMPKLLDVLLVSGTGAGTRVYIPRISLAPKTLIFPLF